MNESDVLDIIEEVIGYRPTKDQTIQETGMDSLDVQNVLIEIEAKSGRTINASGWQTVGDIVRAAE